MFRRNINILLLSRKYVQETLNPVIMPKYTTIKFNKGGRVKYLQKTTFLSPKVIYANYIIKRNCKTDAGNKYNRHNYDEKIETLINNQICVEFGAGYTYLNMASYYGRSDVALPGLHGFFMKMYYEELDHGMGFIKYQNLRGGVVRLMDIPAMERFEWCDIVKCFKCAIGMEKTVKEALLQIYCVGEKLHDTDVLNMLDIYIAQQEASIYEIARLLTRAKLLTGTEVGKYLFDKELHETHVRMDPPKFNIEIGPKFYK